MVRNPLSPTPVSNLRLSRFQIAAYGLIPNTSLQNRPLMIYHSVFLPSSNPNADSISSHLTRIPHGVRPAWRYTMYSQDHFHSTSHEVLAIASGSAKCSFGHMDNPKKVEVELNTGDVVIVPAGVCHRMVEETRRPFMMVGSYPEGCEWDMCYGTQGEGGKVDRIRGLVWLKADPIYGDGGPAVGVWKE